MKFLNDTTNPVCRTEELSAPVSQKKTVPKSALKKKQGTPAPVAVKQPNSAKKLQVYCDIPLALESFHKQLSYMFSELYINRPCLAIVLLSCRNATPCPDDRSAFLLYMHLIQISLDDGQQYIYELSRNM